MNITKADVRLRALDNIAEAYDLINDGEFEKASANLSMARIYVDMLDKMEAGAVNMRVESIEFGDGKAPFEVALEKGENSK